MRLVLDSEAVSALAAGDSAAKRQVRRAMTAAHRLRRDVTIPTVILAELYRGAGRSQLIDSLLAREEKALELRDTDRTLARLVGAVLVAAGAGSEDLADAHVLALAPEAENQTYNIDGSEEVTILRIAETVHRLLGGKGIEFVPARTGDYGGKQVSSAKAAREIGWTPKVNFDLGMERTVAWFLETQGRPALHPA